MKRAFSLCAAALMLTLALPVSALAAETAAVCYPTSVTRSEDGTELKKIYDLAPEEDPAGIPRSDFEQDGFRYTLTDLLKQDLPEHVERQHTETVSVCCRASCAGSGSIQRPSLSPVRTRTWPRCSPCFPRSVNSSPMTDSWVP